MRPSDQIREIKRIIIKARPVQTSEDYNLAFCTAITCYLDEQYEITNSTNPMLRGTPPAKKAVKGKKVIAKKTKKVVKNKKK